MEKYKRVPLEDTSDASIELDFTRNTARSIRRWSPSSPLFTVAAIAMVCTTVLSALEVVRIPLPDLHARLPWSDAQVDPYKAAGYMFWSADVNQTRWIPWAESDMFADFETEHELLDPPAEALARAAPQFNLWSTLPGLESDERLAFMRNKHLVINCDSHCTAVVEGFCGHHEKVGATFKKEHHTWAVCHLPALNFTMTNFFHFGILPGTEEWYVAPNWERKPHEHSQRLEKFHMPLISKYGFPALLIFDSNQWDQVYFEQRGKHLGYADKAPAARRGYSWKELAYQRRRVKEMIETLRKTFPEVPIMWKPSHLRAWSTRLIGLDGRRGSADVEHVNFSLGPVMQHLNVPTMDWASKVQGSLDYEDWAHFNKSSAPNWLAADMALFYLSRV